MGVDGVDFTVDAAGEEDPVSFFELVAEFLFFFFFFALGSHHEYPHDDEDGYHPEEGTFHCLCCFDC